MNRDGKKLLGAVMVVIALGAFLAVWRFSRPARNEPVYQGKSLTTWLKQLDDGQAFGISSSHPFSLTPAQLEAAQAIHAMGTNALPWLMLDIQARPAVESLSVRFYRWARTHLPRWLSSRFNVQGITEEDRIRWRAAQGLSALGPLARPALPELQRLLLTNLPHSSIKEAAYALAAIGPEGAAVLTNAVSPASEWSGMCAIWALGQHPATGTNYLPFFINLTASKSEGTVEGAIDVLGLFHTDAGQVIPVLTNILAGTNYQLRWRAAHALGEFGPQAASALPQLQSLATDPKLRTDALQAMHDIQRILGD